MDCWIHGVDVAALRTALPGDQARVSIQRVNHRHAQIHRLHGAARGVVGEERAGGCCQTNANGSPKSGHTGLSGQQLPPLVEGLVAEVLEAGAAFE